MTKVTCEACEWRGTTDDQLSAPNPFDAEETLAGCPNCKSVNCFRMACDEPDCWRDATSGFPTPNGYRQTCHDHWKTAHEGVTP